MKVNIINDKVEEGMGYAFYSDNMLNNTAEVSILECDRSIDIEKDSFLNFLYHDFEEKDSFRKIGTFLFFKFNKELNINFLNVTFDIIKGIVYPDISKNLISTSIISYDNSWKALSLNSNDICLLNEEITDNTINIFVGLTYSKFPDKSENSSWNFIVDSKNFNNILKSKIIEELINAKIFG